MKNINTIMSAIAGVFCLIYDLWLIHAGHLHAITLLALVAWMAVLMTVCTRKQRRNRQLA